MIMLHELRVVILTPPKTASDALHRALCTPEIGGLAVVGPSQSGAIDKHLCHVPAECCGYRVLATVRHPYDRLVSLYHQWCRHETYWGRATIAFWHFAGLACRPSEPMAPLYRLTLDDWLGAVDCELLRCETLVEDLERCGLPLPGRRMMRSNESWRRPWREYYDDGTLATVREWCERDCRRFGYGHAAS